MSWTSLSWLLWLWPSSLDVLTDAVSWYFLKNVIGLADVLSHTFAAVHLWICSSLAESSCSVSEAWGWGTVGSTQPQDCWELPRVGWVSGLGSLCSRPLQCLDPLVAMGLFNALKTTGWTLAFLAWGLTCFSEACEWPKSVLIFVFGVFFFLAHKFVL